MSILLSLLSSNYCNISSCVVFSKVIYIRLWNNKTIINIILHDYFLDSTERTFHHLNFIFSTLIICMVTIYCDTAKSLVFFQIVFFMISHHLCLELCHLRMLLSLLMLS